MAMEDNMIVSENSSKLHKKRLRTKQQQRKQDDVDNIVSRVTPFIFGKNLEDCFESVTIRNITQQNNTFADRFDTNYLCIYAYFLFL